MTTCFARSSTPQTAATFVSTSSLRCSAPRLPAAAVLPLSASIDGGAHFGALAPRPLLMFDGRLPPLALRVSPEWVDAARGGIVTVMGTNLAPTANLACVFEQIGQASLCRAFRISPQLLATSCSPHLLTSTVNYHHSIWLASLRGRGLRSRSRPPPRPHHRSIANLAHPTGRRWRRP